ncbi:uncharacterized protein LOC114738238 [Neltuma alba]|uniref:uncharacterized protein LOC114738238 n=1 Tax=Neltuma alba TaxID=207710 RepID=UPI0010A34088|nr:uncharacterized protein LOC114738238 [Prosopis alba]
MGLKVCCLVGQSLVRKWRTWSRNPVSLWVRSLRSKAALEAIAKASEERVPGVALYNYPSFSGAYSALFAHLFRTYHNIPCLILPFSSVEPLRVEDLNIEGLETCYLLDFLCPKEFLLKLSQQLECKVIGFDHQKSVLPCIPDVNDCPGNLTLHVNLEKSSSSAVYEYFSAKHGDITVPDHAAPSLQDSKVRDRVELVLKYIEDGDLRRWSLPNIRAFNFGMGEWRSRFNCIANPYMYEQLLELTAEDLVAKGNSHLSSRQSAANKLLGKFFRVRLGRGFYGECLGVRADENSNLSEEIGKLLSVKSAAAGLR